MESKILLWINNSMHSNTILNSFWTFISKISDSGFIWIIFIAVLLLFKDTRKLGFIVGLSLAFSAISGFIIKNLIARPRPYDTNPELLEFLKSMSYNTPDSYSFPSGHTSSAFAVSFALLFVNKKYSYPSLILSILIAFSRLFLCVHYPIDIIGGAMLGIISSYITINIFNNLYAFYNKHYKKRIIVNNLLNYNYCN